MSVYITLEGWQNFVAHATSISCESSVVYVIIKLLVYSIQKSTHYILMDCGKFYVTRDIMLLLSTGRSECQQYNHRLNHCSCIEQ